MSSGSSLSKSSGTPTLAARAELAVLEAQQMTGFRLTEPGGFLQHRLEHWREIAGRGIDDLQDLSGRGLLLQRFARLGNQPGIFQRDDRLIGEGADEFDLSFGERLHPCPAEIDRADHDFVTQ